ncbi:MAG: hypothetical protein ACR650_14030 [Methylocystis sp.]
MSNILIERSRVSLGALSAALGVLAGAAQAQQALPTIDVGRAHKTAAHAPARASP